MTVAKTVPKGLQLPPNIKNLLRYATILREPPKNIKLKTIIEPPHVMLHPNAYNKIKHTCDAGKLCFQEEETSGKTKITSNCCTGYSLDLLKLIEKDLDKTFDVTYKHKYEYGAYVNGSWTGLVGDIVNGKADIADLLTISTQRSEVVDFTEAHIDGDLVMALNTHRNFIAFLNFRAFTLFSGTLWLSVFGMIAIASALLMFTEKEVTRQIAWKYAWIDGITYLAGLLFQRDNGGPNPQHVGSRFVYITLAIALLIIMSTYAAVLTANAVSYTEELQVSGFKDSKVIM